jgi:hypothetical protein
MKFVLIAVFHPEKSRIVMDKSVLLCSFAV